MNLKRHTTPTHMQSIKPRSSKTHSCDIHKNIDVYVYLHKSRSNFDSSRLAARVEIQLMPLAVQAPTTRFGGGRTSALRRRLLSALARDPGKQHRMGPLRWDLGSGLKINNHYSNCGLQILNLTADHGLFKKDKRRTKANLDIHRNAGSQAREIAATR